MQRDIKISLIRVIAMFSIVLCHIVQEYEKISFMGQIFNVGVFIFIFMSGFLYGKKDITNAKSWLFKRAIRLFVPIYIFMVLLFVINAFANKSFDVSNYLIYIIGMQGFFPAVEGAAHLWFITALIICYLITPVLYKLKKSVLRMNKMQLIVILGVLMGIQVILSYTLGVLIGRYALYVVLYIFAYYLSFLKDCKLSKKMIILTTIMMLLGLCIRVLSRRYIDGSVLYSNIIVLYTQSIFGIWLFLAVYRLRGINRKLHRVIEYLDSISFEVYIVHYIFISGKYSMIYLAEYTIVNLMLLGVVIFISGILLHKISNCFTAIPYKRGNTQKMSA